jgi:hypothetical protein
MRASERILQEIEEDLQLSTRGAVVYLEGKSDVDIFFALLGRETPPDSLAEGVYIRGLAVGSRRGSGRAQVEQRVRIAHERNYRVFGFVDGDGRPFAELAAQFDDPHPGPLFCWKAYCIENLLARAGWPWPWGDAPDWAQVFDEYSAYVGINRLVREIQDALGQAKLHRHRNPETGKPLLTAADVRAFIETQQGALLGLHPARRFADQVARFRALVQGDVEHGHALFNGKWLVRHLAPARTGRSPDQCRDEWLAHVRAQGGLPEVRERWQRIIKPRTPG